MQYVIFLAGADRDPDREVRLASARWTEKHDVLTCRDEVERPKAGHRVAFATAAEWVARLAEAHGA